MKFTSVIGAAVAVALALHLSAGAAKAASTSLEDLAMEQSEERELTAYFPAEILAVQIGGRASVLRILEAVHPELGQPSVDGVGLHHFFVQPENADRIEAIQKTLGRLGAATGKILPSARIQALYRARMHASRMGEPDVLGLIVKYRDPSKRIAAMKGQRLPQQETQRLSSITGKTIVAHRAMSGESFATYFDSPTDMQTGELLAQRLAMSPDVERVDLNVRHTADFAPNDQYFNLQWNLTSLVSGVRAPQAWDITQGSSSIVVAVVDTGYVPHPDFGARVLAGADTITNPAVSNDGDGRDMNPNDAGDFVVAGQCGTGKPAENSTWHGTHVMGILGASGNNGIGIAGLDWNSRLVPVRALGKCGGSTADIVDGMRWAAGLSVPGLSPNANPARVINMSLSGPGSCGDSATYIQAVLDVMAQRSVVVAAAGNDNINGLTRVPASCPFVMTVTAVGRAGDKAPYSNYSQALEISAPGGDSTNSITDAIGSTGWDGTQGSPGTATYVYKEGTSQATPHVAGTMSLMLAVAPNLTVTQIRDIVQATASAFPAGSRCATQMDCGRGIVNTAAAVARAQSLAGTSTNYTDLYWWPSEDGWGINFQQQGDIIFGTWFSYGAGGKGMWYLMSSLARANGQDVFAGDIYQTAGVPFGQINGQPSLTTIAKVGTMNLYYADNDNAYMVFELNGAVGVKQVERDAFSTPPTCSFVTGSRAGLTNYQDLWWTAAERGWGLNVAHQGDVIFATWFTYGTDGQPMWLVAPDARRTGPGVYTGSVYQTTGRRPEDVTDIPTRLTATNIGTMTLAFADGEHGTFTYNVFGTAGAKQITRNVFSSPQTQCR